MFSGVIMEKRGTNEVTTVFFVDVQQHFRTSVSKPLLSHHPINDNFLIRAHPIVLYSLFKIHWNAVSFLKSFVIVVSIETPTETQAYC